MLHRLYRLVLQNIGLKLTALVLAAALYVHVFSTQTQQFDISVPLHLVEVPPGMTITGRIPQMVDIRVRGPGKELLKLRARRFRTQISVAEAAEGRWQRPIVTGDIELPPGIQAEVVEVVDPKVLNLVFDRLAHKRVPVFPTVTGASSTGFLLSGRIKVEPDTVSLRGPQHLLERYEFCRTAEVGIQGATRSVRDLVAVSVAPEVEARPGSVLVVVPIERLVVRSIEDLPVVVMRSSSVREVQVEPPTGSVEVLGPESIVSRLRPEDLELRIDARNLRPGTHMLMVNVVLNQEIGDLVTVEPAYPEKFRVTLE